MNIHSIKGRLAFLQEAEKLKSVLRSAHTSTGRAESTAEHTWRLCLMVMIFEDEPAGMDMFKILKMYLIHDLGEAVHGDIPAIEQSQALWQERAGKGGPSVPDAHAGRTAARRPAGAVAGVRGRRLVRGQGRQGAGQAGTSLQHNQGLNPPGFDYAFNLSYGQKHTGAGPLFAQIRATLDEGTRRRMAEG